MSKSCPKILESLTNSISAILKRFGDFVGLIVLKNEKVYATGFQKNICMFSFSRGAKREWDKKRISWDKWRQFANECYVETHCYISQILFNLVNEYIHVQNT